MSILDESCGMLSLNTCVFLICTFFCAWPGTLRNKVSKSSKRNCVMTAITIVRRNFCRLIDVAESLMAERNRLDCSAASLFSSKANADIRHVQNRTATVQSVGIVEFIVDERLVEKLKIGCNPLSCA